MSQLKVNSIVPSGGLPSGASGGIIQLKSATKTDFFSMTGTTYTDVPGLSVSITPSSTSNKILILVNLSISATTNYNSFYNIVRGSTNIAQGTESATYNATGGFYTGQSSQTNSNIFNHTHFLDSPATTSSTTYKIQTRSSDASAGLTINRRNADTFISAVSSITVMEISG